MQTGPKVNPVQQILTKRYLEFNKLYVSLDGAGIKKWLVLNTTPSFFNRPGDGSTMDAKETATWLAGQFKQLSSAHADIQLGNFGIHPNHASCSITSHVSYVLKSGAKFKVDSVAVDTWQLVNGMWKLSGIVTTVQKANPVK
jgi:hypothetical protein